MNSAISENKKFQTMKSVDAHGWKLSSKVHAKLVRECSQFLTNSSRIDESDVKINISQTLLRSVNLTVNLRNRIDWLKFADMNLSPFFAECLPTLNNFCEVFVKVGQMIFHHFWKHFRQPLHLHLCQQTRGAGRENSRQISKKYYPNLCTLPLTYCYIKNLK